MFFKYSHLWTSANAVQQWIANWNMSLLLKDMAYHMKLARTVPRKSGGRLNLDRARQLAYPLQEMDAILLKKFLNERKE